MSDMSKSNVEELLAGIDLVHLPLQEVAMQLCLQRWRILAKQQCMDIKVKGHT